MFEFFNWGKKNAFGLDVSDTSIKVLSLGKSGSKKEIRSYGWLKLESAKLVENGVIKEKNELAKKIKQALNEAKPKPIVSQTCLLSLPASRVLTYLFQFPFQFTKKQIQEALIYEVEQVFPLSTADLYTDFQILDKINDKQEVFFVGLPKKIIADWLVVLKSIDLKPIVFDLESLSAARALIKEWPDKKGVMIVDIGARTSVFSVFDQGGLKFNHYLKLGGNLLTKKVSDELGLPFVMAEKMKVAEGFQIEKWKNISPILKKEILPVIDEAKRIAEFYQRKSSQPIEKIILAGGSSLLPGISDYWQEKLSLKVDTGNPLVKIEKGSSLEKEREKILFANVIGLALRALEKNPAQAGINLSPQK